MPPFTRRVNFFHCRTGNRAWRGTQKQLGRRPEQNQIIVYSTGVEYSEIESFLREAILENVSRISTVLGC